MNASPISQLPIPLHLPERMDAENYFVSDANRDAYEWIMRWPDWPSYALILHGNAAAGKTHLAHIWQQRTQASWLDMASATLPEVDDISKEALVLDNVEVTTHNQHTLFHLLNIRQAEKSPLLLVTQEWPLATPSALLPDLVSRLKALPSVTISPPDDALLSAVLMKYFSDRQLRPAPEVITYLLPRMGRSFYSAKLLVEAIDRTALADHRNITLPLVRQVLETGCGNS